MILIDPYHGAAVLSLCFELPLLSFSHRLFMSATSRFTETVYFSVIIVFFVKSGQKQGVILLITNT